MKVLLKIRNPALLERIHVGLEKEPDISIGTDSDHDFVICDYWPLEIETTKPTAFTIGAIEGLKIQGIIQRGKMLPSFPEPLVGHPSMYYVGPIPVESATRFARARFAM